MARSRSWYRVVVRGVGLALYFLVRHATVTTGNPNFVPSLILLGAVAPASFLTFMAGRRIGYGVSGGLVAFAALVGGVVGVVTAGLLGVASGAGFAVLETMGYAFVALINPQGGGCPARSRR